MEYSKLNIKRNNTTKELDINGNTIHVLQYLPIEDKNEIVMLAVQESEINGIYSSLYLNMFTKVFMVFYYTDIEFTDRQKEEITRLYDQLESSGLLDEIMSTIPDDERMVIFDSIRLYKEAKMKANLSAANVIKEIAETLPTDASKLVEQINQFDPEQFKYVMQLAEDTGKRD